MLARARKPRPKRPKLPKKPKPPARPKPPKRPRPPLGAGPRGGPAGLPKHPIGWPWPAKPPRRRPINRRSLASFLARHPQVAKALIWRGDDPTQAPNGVPTSFPQWTPAQKAELADTWRRIRTGSYKPYRTRTRIGLVLSPNGELFSTTFAPKLAWKIYVAYVAQSLAVEADHLVGWSVDDYTPAQLTWLFDSKSLFHYSWGLDRYFTPRWHSSLESLGAAQPGDSIGTFEYALGHGFIGADPTQTIERVLDWCRANLAHFYGDYAPANLFDHWGARTWPTVGRILAGTRHSQFGFAHWTAGCWGTAGFLRLLLRTLNIPASLEEVDGHALPHFHLPPSAAGASRDLYLSHGDDPYNSLWRATPPVPIGELPLKQTEYDAWFGPNAIIPPTTSSNVSRQTIDLSVRHLSNPLLRYHCGDLSAGRTPAQSEVYDPNVTGLGRFYTVAELQAMNLWTNLDAKLAMIGGCANVPP